MILVSTLFQKSRSRRNPGKPGKIYLRLSEKKIRQDGSSVWADCTVSSGIAGDSRTALVERHRDLVVLVRMLYCIVEQRLSSGTAFSLGDVASDFRLTVGGDESMEAVRKKAQAGFPFRKGVIAVGNSFKGDFSFISSVQPVEGITGLLSYISVKSDNLALDGKTSFSRSCVSTAKSLSRHLEGRDIAFSRIDRTFVLAYGEWLRRSGVSPSTQSFYLRTLRSILNHAKADGLFDFDGSLFAGMNTKVDFGKDAALPAVLDREALRKIAAADFSSDKELDLARDLFMFGFYCRGMELTDIIGLESSAVKNGFLTYRRRKNGQTRTVPLDRAALEIIGKYSPADGPLIFPVLDMWVGRKTSTIKDRISRQIRTLGNAVGVRPLTFRMNIQAWKQLSARLDLSAVILGA